MKLAVIDIGSNSVRLMIWADGKTLLKKINTTRLGEGLTFSPVLKREAIERTAAAVAEFRKEALSLGADRVYSFATAAVRSAKNGAEFVSAAYSACGISVDVVSGEEEAAMGLLGAIGDGDGGIIDVGGASTEVTVRIGGETVYAKSVNVGTVRIFDAAGRNIKNIAKFISPAIAEYGAARYPEVKFYAVGGTASRLGAITRNVIKYDASAIDGAILSREHVYSLAERLTSTSVEEIRATTICGKASDLIGGGAYLLASVMEKFGIASVIVSESDNLEGYIKIRGLDK